MMTLTRVVAAAVEEWRDLKTIYEGGSNRNLQ